MLSKSFGRRINQNIAIDFKDVPINRYISQVKSVTGLPWQNQMDECGSYSRDSNLDKFVERLLSE
jgi:hypothetical protein